MIKKETDKYMNKIPTSFCQYEIPKKKKKKKELHFVEQLIS